MAANLHSLSAPYMTMSESKAASIHSIPSKELHDCEINEFVTDNNKKRDVPALLIEMSSL